MDGDFGIDVAAKVELDQLRRLKQDIETVITQTEARIKSAEEDRRLLDIAMAKKDLKKWQDKLETTNMRIGMLEGNHVGF